LDKQEILSEDYLAAYISGEVSAEQSAQIEEMISADNEVRAEYRELQKTLELLAFRHAVAPPSRVKQLVMQDEKVMKHFDFGDTGTKARTSHFMVAASVTISAFYLWTQWQNTDYLSAEQQYQLWALVDGVSIDAGVFDASRGTFQIMKAIAEADAFAVTIEQTGGAESPTLSTMQVYGEPMG
jgi:anti-sigma-K factor RskA